MAALCESCEAAFLIEPDDPTVEEQGFAVGIGSSSSTTTHPSSISAPGYFDTFQDFAHGFNAALQGAFPINRRQRDTKVGVLLLSFEDDDMEVFREIEKLQKVFEQDFGYTPEPWLIPKDESQQALSNRLYEFRKEHCPQKYEENDLLPLLIVYYAGHAAKPPRGESTCIWSGKRTSPCAQLNWTEVQPVLFGAPADVLLILDCCYASSAAWRASTTSIGSKETIAASGPSSLASGVGAWSFTAALIRQLELYGEENHASVLTAAALHGFLLQDHSLRFQPTYARSHRSTRHSSALTPFSRKAARTSLGLATVLSAEPTPTIVRVLLAIHVKGHPSDDLLDTLHRADDLVPFLRNESGLPTSVVSMNVEEVREVYRIEAAFRGFSTLVLVSVPLAAWHLLPDHGGCRFVSLATGPNLLAAGAADGRARRHLAEVERRVKLQTTGRHQSGRPTSMASDSDSGYDETQVPPPYPSKTSAELEDEFGGEGAPLRF